MAETSNSRIDIRPGEQKSFLIKSKRTLGLSWKELADLLGISVRTLTDWRRGKFTMQLRVARILCRKTYQPLRFKTKEAFWYVHKAALLGGRATYSKYGRVGGSEERRKKMWYRWWEETGRFKQSPIFNKPFPIQKPKFSKELAEFVGIMLGDGGLSMRQLTVSLHHIDDRAYGEFVSSLIMKLFAVPVAQYHDPRDSVIDYVVSRTELIRFCNNKLGLVIGNKIKQQIDIPSWVKRNRSYLVACVRGLVDTDGSVFEHRYQVNGKWYSYTKLSFTSLSKPLARSVLEILKSEGIHARLSQEKDVCIDGTKSVRRYFEIIGSHNPKHLQRYHKGLRSTDVIRRSA